MTFKSNQKVAAYPDTIHAATATVGTSRQVSHDDSSQHSQTVTPKPGKCPTKMENYMLTSLTDIDAKILNTVFANQIQEYIEKITHQSQRWFNVCKLTNAIHRKNRLNDRNH